MTETVYWPHVQANTSTNKVEITIVAWDYEQKRGTATLPGGYFVEVRQITALAVVSAEEKK
jgi:hypothetical protein